MTGNDQQSKVEDVFINSANLSHAQVNALNQLLQFQCACLEKKLTVLQVKRRMLLEGKSINVSLNELVSRELIEAAEQLSMMPKVNQTHLFNNEDLNKNMNFLRDNIDSIDSSIATKEEISRIINVINTRNNKHVQFLNVNEGDDDNNVNYKRINRRSITLPNHNANVELSGEIQLILHSQGNCKPCAFFYNNKKGCRNGPSCGFCHHEDHSLCTLKQWKKQHKLFPANNFAADASDDIRRCNSEHFNEQNFKTNIF